MSVALAFFDELLHNDLGLEAIEGFDHRNGGLLGIREHDARSLAPP